MIQSLFNSLPHEVLSYLRVSGLNSRLLEDLAEVLIQLEKSENKSNSADI